MKKLVLTVFALVATFALFAQTIESKKDGDYYYLVSPNARYYAGSQQGSAAYRYDIETKETIKLDPNGEHGFKTNAISNDGVVAGAYEFKASLWIEGEDYELLPLPDGLTELEMATNDAVAITPDGKQIVVAFNADAPKTYYVYTENADGLYDMVKLPMPEKDPIYGMYAQWIGIKDISADGNTLVGFFLTDDGLRQLPLIWKNKGGVWSYEFFGLGVCLKEGKTIPPYPYDKLVEVNGELSLPYDVWEAWVNAQNEAETGHYYQMKGMMMSGNAKYVSFNVGIHLEGETYGTIYAAAYDLEKGKLEIFKNMADATSLSVNDEGEVIVATPATEEFRWSNVVSISEPAKSQTLTEWVKNRTEGAIDLAEYMEYQLPEETTVAEGTAYWAKEGAGLVTYQANMMGTGLYESYFILFGVKSADRPIYNDSQISFYPNPTSGLLNVSKSISDVVIYDVIGRKVYTCSNVENCIDLTELQVGQYFLVGTVDRQRVSTKLMIKK